MTFSKILLQLQQDFCFFSPLGSAIRTSRAAYSHGFAPFRVNVTAGDADIEALVFIKKRDGVPYSHLLDFADQRQHACV